MIPTTTTLPARSTWQRLIMLFCILCLFTPAGAQSLSYSPPMTRMNITSSYGMRMHPILGVYKFHAGIDLAARRDTVRSILQGQILSMGYSKTLGYFVATIHGELTILYGHLSAIRVKPESFVQAGDILGITGSSGLSTGDHLHLEVRLLGRTIDPVLLFKYLQKLNQ